MVDKLIPPELANLLALLPLPDKVSAVDAAEILGGGRHRVTDFMNLVADGDIVSWTHSPMRGPLARYIDHLWNEERFLPRISWDTDPNTVMLPGDDVLWHWCVQLEGRQSAPKLPPKDAVERRLQQVYGLLRSMATAAASETPQQRAARWLEELEEEEKTAKRGALARLAARHGIDPSNMSKAIKRARDARASAARDGAMYSQLVRKGENSR